MFERREILALLGALTAGRPALAAVPGKGRVRSPVASALGTSKAFDWAWLQAEAERLAARPPRPPHQADPRTHAVDYDAANRIRFREDRGLFVDDGYAVRLFPLGRYAPTPVDLFVVDRGSARPIEHSENMFEVAPGEGPAPQILPGVSGFRPITGGGVGDWLAFQGASYFRSAGPLNQYGLSARGVAIDTGIDGREEFPVFTAFWLERTDAGLTIYALLEGASLTGAYRFLCTKGRDAVVIKRQLRRPVFAPRHRKAWRCAAHQHVLV